MGRWEQRQLCNPNNLPWTLQSKSDQKNGKILKLFYLFHRKLEVSLYSNLGQLHYIPSKTGPPGGKGLSQWVKFRNDPTGQFLCESSLTKATALKLAYWEIWVGGASVPRRNKVEVNMEPLHATLPLATENNTSSATDSVKLNKVKHGASTRVPEGTNFKAVTCSGQHCALLSALVRTVEVTVPKLSSYFQVSVSNAREISLKYGLSLSSWSLWGVGGVKFPSPWHTLPNTVFTLLQMEPVLSLSIWDDFTRLQKALACWRKMVCDCELCLYYFKYAFLGYHSLLTVVNKPFQNEIRVVSSY